MAVNLRWASASGLVVAGVLAAAVVGQLPAFGAPDGVQVATPTSAGQSLVCPGSAVAVGAAGTGASAFSASGKPVRTAGTASGAKPEQATLAHGAVSGGAGPRALTAATAARVGPIAGAQREQATGDAAGLVATACTTPGSDEWLVGGATTTGRTTVLTLANASAVAAEVSVRVWSEEGPVDATSSNEVAVPAKGRKVVALAGVAPSAGGTVVRVTSSGGRVGAALEQRTVRGLESGGVDMVGPTTAPARQQVVPGVRVGQAAAVAAASRQDDYADLQPVVRVLVPGEDATDVSISVRPEAGGQAIVLGRRVAAGVVTDFPVTGLADGTYTVVVTAKQPLLAGVRTSTVSDASASTTPSSDTTTTPPADGSDAVGGSDAGLVGGDGPVDASSGSSADSASTAPAATSTARGIDLAWFAAAPATASTSAVAVVDAPSPVLSISSVGAARTIRLSGATQAQVRVPANGSVAVPVTPGLLVLRDAAGLRAAVSYAGTDAVAGYPVAAADQQAHAVRISR